MIATWTPTPLTSAAPTAVARAQRALDGPSLEPRRLARVAITVSLVFGVLGFVAFQGWRHTYILDLDAEFYPASLWSFGLLVLATVTSALAAIVQSSRAAAAFGAAMLFMAVDELTSIHEHLENVTGVDWQVLYLPVVAVVGVAFLILLLRLLRVGERASVVLLLAGAGAWFVAQVFEAIQWDGDRQTSAYAPLATAEEVLEMLGSLAFALALLVWARRKLPAGPQ